MQYVNAVPGKKVSLYVVLKTGESLCGRMICEGTPHTRWAKHVEPPFACQRCVGPITPGKVAENPLEYDGGHESPVMVIIPFWNKGDTFEIKVAAMQNSSFRMVKIQS